MALKIRLQRKGAKNAPKYRLVVAEASAPRDGRFVEVLGHYNPRATASESECEMSLERVQYWMGVGAKASGTAEGLIKRYRKNSTAQSKSEKTA